MSYYIAMDAGGTKTETVLFDETGHVLLRDINKGATAMDFGADTCIARVTESLRRVAAHIPSGKPDYAFCGVSSVIYYKAISEMINIPIYICSISKIDDIGLSRLQNIGSVIRFRKRQLVML